MSAITKGLALSFLLISANAYAQDHQSAPMRAGGSTVPDEHQARAGYRAQQEEAARQSDNDLESSSFKEAYEKAGSPKIAIFWNTKFDDQLSQWTQVERISVTGESSGQLNDTFKKQGDVKKEDVFGDGARAVAASGGPSGEIIGSYERDVSGGSKIVAAEYKEVRRWRLGREGLSDEKADFEFGAGYTKAFIKNRTTIVDRKAIMRLIERDNAREAGAEMIADYQKVETDALIGYADYFAEVVMTPQPEAPLGMSFMVSVKEVATGRVVVMFSSDGRPMNGEAPEQQWVVTENGYESISLSAEAGPQAVGQQLAIETMEELANVWR